MAFSNAAPDAVPMADGISELVAEYSRRRNLLGNETAARFFSERNETAIDWILDHATPRTWDILGKRLADEKLAYPLRLLYAALLAANIDPRGKNFLIEAAKTTDEKNLAEVLFCFGAVPWLRASTDKTKIDLAWAEPTLLGVMSRQNAKVELEGARIAARYSSVAEILLWLNTEAARKVLIDFALSISELISLLPVDLSRFGTYIDREGFRRLIVAHLIELTGESFGVDADACNVTYGMYLGAAGHGDYATQGILTRHSAKGFSDVLDGTANTFLLGEISWKDANCYRVFTRGCEGSASAPAKNILNGINLVPYTPAAPNFNDVTGNSGPQGFAEIKDGRYQTPADKGPIGGPHIVRVTGYDQMSTDEANPAKPLFPEYTTNLNLPKDKSATQDIQVPADWKGAAPAQRRPQPAGP